MGLVKGTRSRFENLSAIALVTATRRSSGLQQSRPFTVASLIESPQYWPQSVSDKESHSINRCRYPEQGPRQLARFLAG